MSASHAGGSLLVAIIVVDNEGRQGLRSLWLKKAVLPMKAQLSYTLVSELVTNSYLRILSSCHIPSFQ